MKIAIIDDIKEDREYLSKTIDSCITDMGFSGWNIDEYESGKEFLAHFAKGKYNLIFLDILMDGMNGIEIARQIRKVEPLIRLIFISVSNDFASESYSVHADYYLLKPCGKDDLMNAMKKVHLHDFAKRTVITLPNGHEISAQSIIYTSFSGHYVTIYQTEGEVLKIRCTQKSFEQRILPCDGFVLCTKGMIANLNEVSRLETDRFIMSNGAYVPVSRRKYAAIKKIYSEYLIDKIRKQRR